MWKKGRLMPIKSAIRLSIITLVLTGSPLFGAEMKGVSPINGLDARIEALKEEGHFPGIALAVMRKGKPVNIGTYGMANIAHSVPVTTLTSMGRWPCCRTGHQRQWLQVLGIKW
jgi:hypothetical protein